ncbi:TonB-dependent receptor [Maribacter sp. 2304DJ31-5]|uniref:TonB-dependent receptor n=1 Tax=Maribacter sp. 2304DJ31-5 TaxID=3386273 RepID=UPI0039BCF902
MEKKQWFSNKSLENLSKKHLKMKLSLLLFAFALMNLQANDMYSQNTKISLQIDNEPISEILEHIESESKFIFFYNTSEIDVSKKVSLNVVKTPIKQILDIIFNDGSISYTVLKKQIVLKKNTVSVQSLKKELKEASINPVQFTLTGSVTDADGQPLPGASIIEKGTTNGTQTDFDGNYSISVENGNTTLVVSYIGFATREVSVNGQSVLNIALQEDTAALDEVVVVGYGVKKVKDLTGSVSSVSGADFQDNALPTASLALQGRAAGVRIDSNGGRPGSEATITIRGQTTRNNNTPLFVIDGQIVDSGLSTLNPNEIESISVLKDASTAAIYGSRAAAGVVVITTKRGLVGKAVIEYDTYYTFDRVINKLDVLNAQEWETINTEYFTNAGQTSGLVTPAVRGETDWQDQVFRTGTQQNHHLSVRGGSEKHQYAFHGGYYHQEGVVKGAELDRYNFRMNNDFWVGKKLKFTTSMDISYAEANQTDDGGVVFLALQSPPNIAPFDSNGDLVFSGYTRENPLAVLNIARPEDDNLRGLGNISAEYEIIKGLKARTFVSTEFVNTSFNRFNPTVFYPQDAVGANNRDVNTLETRTRRTFVWTWDNFLTYNRNFGDHNVSAMFGHSAQSSTSKNWRIDARNFLSNIGNLQFVDATLTPDETRGSGNKREWSIASLIGSVSYGYKSKYLLDASFRKDRSSRIHPDFRDAFFPSVSAAWVLSDESFFDVGFINRLKIRANWGKLGNERSVIRDRGRLIPVDYPYQSVYQTGADAIFGGALNTGVFSPRAGNNALQWETTETKDIGLDLDLFDNSLSLTSAFFIKDTDGILFSPDASALTGIAAPIQNTSNIRNTGIELALTYRKTFGDFSMEISPNYTYIKNEIVSLSPAEDAIDASIGRSRVGRPLSTFDIGYIADGIFQNQAEVNAHATQVVGSGPENSTAPGDVRFKDLNDDGVINAADRDWIGVGIPPHNFGLNIFMKYKNFDLNLSGTGQAGGQQIRRGGFHNFVRPFEIVAGYLRNRWTGEGTSNLYPRIIAGDPNNNERLSTLQIESTDYLRIQNIQLGYTLPQSALDKLNLSNLRVYVAGQNIATFTNFQGYDPQTGYGGTPVPLSVYLGLNVKI